MQPRRVFVQIPAVCQQISEFAKLRTTFSTNASFTQHSCWLAENGKQLFRCTFSFCQSWLLLFVFCLCTESLWCLMKLLPQRHVTSEVTEGLPQWGQSVWDNCFFTIGLTFMALWLTLCVCVCDAQWFWAGPVPAWLLLMVKQNNSKGYEQILNRKKE